MRKDLVTLIKFMTKEEFLVFINGIMEIRFTNDKRNRKGYVIEPRRAWIGCNLCPTSILYLERLDFENVLKMGEGYIRYDTIRDSRIYDFLTETYEFVEENDFLDVKES